MRPIDPDYYAIAARKHPFRALQSHEKIITTDQARHRHVIRITERTRPDRANRPILTGRAPCPLTLLRRMLTFFLPLSLTRSVMAREPASLDFPLAVSFKIIALAPQLSLTDARGHLIGYVRQKMFRLKEAVTIFSDAEQKHPVYRIAADRVMDISAQYRVEDASGAPVGVLRRRGLRSIWSAHYEIYRSGQQVLEIREENPWSKVGDSIFGNIPLIGMLSGYVFHPAYRVSYSQSGTPLLRVVKQPAMWEGRYTIDRAGSGDPEDERLAVLCVLMMLLLERSRG